MCGLLTDAAAQRLWVGRCPGHARRCPTALPAHHATPALRCAVQPSSEADMRLALELLASEVQQHADIVIVPGGPRAKANACLQGSRMRISKWPA